MIALPVILPGSLGDVRTLAQVAGSMTGKWHSQTFKQFYWTWQMLYIEKHV